jgi:hypothetical protein
VGEGSTDETPEHETQGGAYIVFLALVGIVAAFTGLESANDLAMVSASPR